MLISPDYREQNRQLHASHATYGDGGAKWAPYVERLCREEGYATVLDYGCGKGRLAAALPQLAVAEYDPAVAGKDRKPAPADLVVCTDVLEHVEPEHIDSVLEDLRRVAVRKLFFNIATRPAVKALPDGRNAHLTVEPPTWWHARLSRYFHILTWQVRPGMVYGEAFARSASEPAFRRAEKRREVTPQLRAMIEGILAHVNRYADAFGQIRTWSMWEGVGDKPADLQVACRIIEAWPDANAAMGELVKLAAKAVVCMIELRDGRSAADWRKLIERHLRVASWEEAPGAIVVIGAPRVVVDGVHAVGAVSSEERWRQVTANVARVRARIEPQPAHSRKSVLACYGPSLGATIGPLRDLAVAGADVISVSGAHDFLIEYGILPRFHVECDARRHKADNIEKAHPAVAYLLASCCHSSLFDKIAGADIRLWHVSAVDQTMRLIDELGEPQGTVISGGGSVGLRAIPLLYALGYRDLAIFGMDSSFGGDGAQWAGPHAGKRQDEVTVRCGERMFKTSPILLSYACDFFDTIQKAPGISYELFGDGLLQEMARHYAMGTLEAA